MNDCPHCGRKLLSHISPKCSWCGVEIEDAQYRAQAEVERAAQRAEEALHSFQSLTLNPVTPRYSRLDYSRFDQVSELFGLPTSSPQNDAAASARWAEYLACVEARREAKERAEQLKPSQGKASQEAADDEADAESDGRFGHLEL